MYLKDAPDYAGLNRLADYLDIVREDDFEQTSWLITDGVLNQALLDNIRRTGTLCGTAACIAGHATIMFPKRLRMELTSIGTVVVASTKNREVSDAAAFAGAFKIPYAMAQELVSGLALHNTPVLAAKAIRQTIKNLKRARYSMGTSKGNRKRYANLRYQRVMSQHGA